MEKKPEKTIDFEKIKKDRKSQTLPVLNLVLAFVKPPFGAFLAIIIAIILLKSKNQDKTISQVGLIFASAIFLLFLLLLIVM